MNNYSTRLPVGLVGYRGYSGAELVRLVTRHPALELVLLEHRSDPQPKLEPLGQRPITTLPATVEAVRDEKLAAVLFATPAEVSLKLVPDFLEAGMKVIDLSGAFRLRDAETYSRWYGERHTAPHLLDEAVYGLPEFYREQIPSRRLIANPGCYPTAANLALRPLIASQIIDRGRGIICDAKSGISGAGRKPSLKTSFCETAENFSVYSLFEHRHVPEVLQNSGLGEREFTFTAQLLPVRRGILETIYFRTQRLERPIDVLSIYEEAYAEEPFIRLYAPGKVPDLQSVSGTNFCDIGFVFEAESQRAVVVVAIDNLVKGAAGQAIQNLNLMLGFAESEGLL